MSTKAERARRKVADADAVLSESIRVLAEEVPKLIETKNYNEIARAGARHAAFYLEQELKRGVSEEDAQFMPEAYVYKAGKLASVVAISTETSDFSKVVTALFTKDEPTMILFISGAWISEMARTNGGRASQQPDRVNAGVGTVYLAPNNVVASVGKPVKTAKAA